MRSHSGRPTPPPQFKKQGRIHCSPSMILCVCFCRPTEQINQCWMNVCALGWPTPPPRFTSIADVCKAEKTFADGEDRRRVSKQVSTHVKGQFVTGYYLQGPCVFEIPQGHWYFFCTVIKPTCTTAGSMGRAPCKLPSDRGWGI